MKWIAVVAISLGCIGCSQKPEPSPKITGAQETTSPKSANDQPNTPGPTLSDAQTTGRYSGIVPGSPGERAYLALSVDKKAVLAFRGGSDARVRVLEGTWSIQDGIVRVRLSKSDGKSETGLYIFTMNEEGNVLSGSNQNLEQQGPMLSLKKE